MLENYRGNFDHFFQKFKDFGFNFFVLLTFCCTGNVIAPLSFYESEFAFLTVISLFVQPIRTKSTKRNETREIYTKRALSCVEFVNFNKDNVNSTPSTLQYNRVGRKKSCLSETEITRTCSPTCPSHAVQKLFKTDDTQIQKPSMQRSVKMCKNVK